MQMQLEHPEKNSIQAYTNQSITIHDREYFGSLILSPKEIISDIKIKSLKEINETFMQQLLHFEPKIILIGHIETGKLPPAYIFQALEGKQTGIECMSVGAACRTWNVLLSEGRSVVAGFIFPDKAIP